jgi:hypothetical protein
MNSTESEVIAALDGSEPVLVLVYAPAWPDMPEEWDACSAAYQGSVRMMKVHVTPRLSMMYGLHHFPTFLSNYTEKHVGYTSRNKIEAMLFKLECSV